ncbi:acid phosphatase [Lysobacteraceae bacterium NML75-0749]|nr:acid phosphatase [Xanthomonadaceae bacterium NML75-0749]PJK03668.1 acid phosphatase [Xanthomonadaceae bacterium NML91-0268]
MPILRKTRVLAATLCLAACQHMPERPASLPPQPPAAHDNLNAVVWMQRSDEYAAATRSLYRAAARQLDAILASGEEALAGNERSPGDRRALPAAIIMDIDETVLDNSPYQARLVADGGEFDNDSWNAWVTEKKARVIPGALEFTQAAAARGITIFYISNREAALSAETLENLRAAGLPVKTDENVFLGLGTQVPGCEQVGSEKLCRRQLVSQKYRVVMQFGDQLGDFVEIRSNTPEARAALSGQYSSWWGERWWMLPNPSYGGWESALLGENRRASPEARRRIKQDALQQYKQIK